MNYVEPLEQEEIEPVLKVKTPFSDALDIVRGVITAYLHCAERPPVSAMQWDKSAPQFKWTPVSAEFIADTESALRRLLVKRQDRVELRAAWHRLCESDKPKIGDAERKLVLALAPILRKNGLEPHRYFRRIKRKSR